MTARPGAPTMSRVHKALAGIVAMGAAGLATIGFIGSYGSVRGLAAAKGFGWFANLFPIGIDAGIVVLLALDLLMTWWRISLPMLRYFAWGLTVATITFNASVSWPDPIGVGMHAAIPVLFIAIVEASRHTVGRIADITADRDMEPVRLARWLLAPLPTFRLWRRMKLWELRSYDETIRREQDRLVYRIRLRARYGVNWRRKAPVEDRIPLRLARHGVPLGGADTSAVPALSAADTTPDTKPVRADNTPRTSPDKPRVLPAGQARTAIPSAPDITADAKADKGADTPLNSPDTVRTPVSAPTADIAPDTPSVAAIVRDCFDADTRDPDTIMSAVRAVHPDADPATVKRTLRREAARRTNYM